MSDMYNLEELLFVEALSKVIAEEISNSSKFIKGILKVVFLINESKYSDNVGAFLSYSFIINKLFLISSANSCSDFFDELS